MPKTIRAGIADNQFGRFIGFVALAYALTWSCTVPFVYLFHDTPVDQIPPWFYVLTIGVFGPTLAALILNYRRGGALAVKELLARYGRWRVNPLCWVFALGYSLLIASAASFVEFGFVAWRGFSIAQLLAAAPLVALVALPFGPLPEELGWRGFATPLLLERYGILTTSLLVSLAWAFWHTPMLFFPGAAIPSVFDAGALSVFLYWLQLFAETIVMTWLLIWSRGSVLLAVLFHLGNNIAQDLIFQALDLDTAGVALRSYYYIHLALLLLGAGLVHVFGLLVNRSDSAASLIDNQ